jgi:hypothetical protein
MLLKYIYLKLINKRVIFSMLNYLNKVYNKIKNIKNSYIYILNLFILVKIYLY